MSSSRFERSVFARSLAAVTAALLAAIILAACSGTRFAYNNADWFLKHWASEYVQLDGRQLAKWESQFQPHLERHRIEELPQLVGLIDEFLAGAKDGFDPSRSSCIWRGFEELYVRHARYAAAIAAPLLVALTPEQIDGLESKFAQESAERPDPAPAKVERRLRKRSKRFVSAVEWFTGPLEESQVALVKQVSERIPDTAVSWSDFRSDRQRDLIGLLREPAKPDALQTFLADWWAEPDGALPELKRAREALAEGATALISGIGGSLTSKQRTHLLDRLGELRSDLTDIGKIKSVAPLRCSGPATADSTAPAGAGAL